MNFSLIHNSRKRMREEQERLNEEDMIVILWYISFVVAVIATQYHTNNMLKEPSTNRDEERQKFLNCLYNGKQSTCIEQLCVTKQGFRRLCKLLVERGKLLTARNVIIEEVVVMFLHILAHHLKNSTIKCCYSHLGEMVNRKFNSVLQVVL